MKFETEMNAEVTKYNPRKELHGDEGVMAGDINITANLPVSVLSLIAVDEFDFEAVLYNDNEELKQLCFNRLDFFREFDDMRLELTLDEDTDPIIMNNVKIKKLSAELLPGKRVDLSFQAQMHPNEEESGELHVSMLKAGVRVSVSNQSGQSDIEDNADAA